MKNNSLYNKIIALLLVFSMVIMPFNTISYAEDTGATGTTPDTGEESIGSTGNGLQVVFDDTRYQEEIEAYKNYDKGWDGFYKNFIVDLGGVRLTFYKAGAVAGKVEVLPNQFNNSAYRLMKPLVDAEKDVILRNPDGDYIDLTGIKFSDNIPLLADFGDGDKPFTLFNEWTGIQSFADWSKTSSNLESLISDIGMSEDAIFEGKGVIEWLNGGNSLIMEPVTYYPMTNQEIDTSDAGIADKQGLTWTADIFLDALSIADDTNTLTEAEKQQVKNGQYKGSNQGVLRFMTRRLYYHKGYQTVTDALISGAGTFIGFGLDNVAANFVNQENLKEYKRYLSFDSDEAKKSITDKWKNIIINEIPNTLWNDLAGTMTDKLYNYVDFLYSEDEKPSKDELRKRCGQLTTLLKDYMGKTTFADKIANVAIGAGLEDVESTIDSAAPIAMDLAVAYLTAGAGTAATAGAEGAVAGLNAAQVLGIGLKTGTDIRKGIGTIGKYERALLDEEGIIAEHGIDTQAILDQCLINSLDLGLTQMWKDICKGVGDAYRAYCNGVLTLVGLGADIIDNLLGTDALHWDDEKKQYYYIGKYIDLAIHFANLTYTETTTYSYEWVKESFVEDIVKFFGGNKDKSTKIVTDHNKYFIDIPKSTDAKAKEMQQILVGGGALKDEDPMRWGSCLVFGGSPGGLIIIKFNANLDQIGGTKSEDLPSEYWLVGKVGSSEYQWYQKYDDGTEGAKIQKFPKTFPDSIADGLGGENHEYSSYGTIKQTEKGEQVGGKRFIVNKSKTLTQDMVDSALGKQASIDKKSCLDLLRAEMTLYTNENSAKNKEGSAVKMSLSGKDYWIAESNEDKWHNIVETYNEANQDKTDKYTDPDTGKTYTVIVLYVDWIFNDTEGKEGTGRELILYEDELSYVYDYDDIGDDDTRKLQSKINSGGNQHPWHVSGSHCDHTCDNKTHGSFGLTVSHTFGGTDYSNTVLGEQQTSKGDTKGQWSTRGDEI